MRFSAIMLLTLTGLAAIGCQSTGAADRASAKPAQVAPSPGATSSDDPNTATMYVHGMGCPQCANNVDLQLLKVAGVEAVKIDLGSGKVTAKLSTTNPPTREQLAEAIGHTGFTLVKIDMPAGAP